MDNRIRIRNGKQTVRITVTITNEQHSRLKAFAESNGFNTSELVRYALIQLFKQPYIFCPRDILRPSKRHTAYQSKMAKARTPSDFEIRVVYGEKDLSEIEKP